ncbi:hypothetical protein [Haploplasma axanthum]|uniref:Uncharacterized protein n=1 Tax=Haploplasma axanthum TaxID=29552 RepID=A0A449BDT4_HAPAX|nr:hypothetical protein [Haploplasma axanthum]VEU80592.1 Uncharacterised protein [Haploplasma axanthum]
MIVIVIILNIIYSSLIILSNIVNKTKNIFPTTLMILGACLNILFLVLLFWGNFILLNIIGMLLISIAALLNGLKKEKINYSHHLVRFMIEAIIVVFAFLI